MQHDRNDQIQKAQTAIYDAMKKRGMAIASRQLAGIPGFENDAERESIVHDGFLTFWATTPEWQSLSQRDSEIALTHAIGNAIREHRRARDIIRAKAAAAAHAPLDTAHACPHDPLERVLARCAINSAARAVVDLALHDCALTPAEQTRLCRYRHAARQHSAIWLDD